MATDGDDTMAPAMPSLPPKQCRSLLTWCGFYCGHLVRLHLRQCRWLQLWLCRLPSLERLLRGGEIDGRPGAAPALVAGGVADMPPLTAPAPFSAVYDGPQDLQPNADCTGFCIDREGRRTAAASGGSGDSEDDGGSTGMEPLDVRGAASHKRPSMLLPL